MIAAHTAGERVRAVHFRGLLLIIDNGDVTLQRFASLGKTNFETSYLGDSRAGNVTDVSLPSPRTHGACYLGYTVRIRSCDAMDDDSDLTGAADQRSCLLR